MQKFVLASAFATLALPGFARDFETPKGCELFLTVQSKGCSVAVLYTCEGRPEGEFTEVVFDAGGLSSISTYDAQYQWLETYYTWDQSQETLIAPAEDPIDLDALISEGVDTFRFNMTRVEPGIERQITAVGADILTGETVTIDGRELALVQTELQILDEDGAIEYQSRGMQFLDMKARLFFLGLDGVIEPDGAVTEYDGSPVDFIAPGEPGFGSTVPLYECDQLKASFAPLQEPRE